MLKNRNQFFWNLPRRLETPAEKLSASISNMKADTETARRNAKQLAKRLADLMIAEVPKLSRDVGEA